MTTNSEQESEGGTTPAPDPKPTADPKPAASPDSKIWQDEPADPNSKIWQDEPAAADTESDDAGQ